MMKYLLIFVFALSAQGATLAQLRDRIDAFLANHWDNLTNRQQTFFNNHGYYCQVLITHNLVPTHTTAADNDDPPDNITATPHYHEFSAVDLLPELQNVDIPAALVIDVYITPAGEHGYWATLYAVHDGVMYSRSRNVGPTSMNHKTQGWHVVNYIGDQ